MLACLKLVALMLSLGLTLTLPKPMNAQEHGDRIALVLGNAAYKETAQMSHAKRDAESLGEVLSGLGFDVRVGTDFDREGMLDAIRTFGRKAKLADVAVFYYAGLATSDLKTNHLLPIDAKQLRGRYLIDGSTISLSLVLSEISHARRLGIVLLDVNNGNAIDSARTQHIEKDLAPIGDPPSNVAIIAAARFDETTVDGGKRTFTDVVLRHLEDNPDLPLDTLFSEARKAVIAETAPQHEPIMVAGRSAEMLSFASSDRQADISSVVPQSSKHRSLAALRRIGDDHGDCSTAGRDRQEQWQGRWHRRPVVGRIVSRPSDRMLTRRP